MLANPGQLPASLFDEHGRIEIELVYSIRLQAISCVVNSRVAFSGTEYNRVTQRPRYCV